MPRRPQNVVDRFVGDYSNLTESERTQVNAAIRGYEIATGTTGAVTKAAPRRVRSSRISNSGETSGQSSAS
jgi:hypothetical protein